MTNKEIYEMLQNGSTYQEIADIEGISKQAVHQRMILYKRKVCGIRGHGFNIESIVYEGIYDWFSEHYDESVYSLAKKYITKILLQECKILRIFLLVKLTHTLAFCR